MRRQAAGKCRWVPVGGPQLCATFLPLNVFVCVFFSFLSLYSSPSRSSQQKMLRTGCFDNFLSNNLFSMTAAFGTTLRYHSLITLVDNSRQHRHSSRLVVFRSSSSLRFVFALCSASAADEPSTFVVANERCRRTLCSRSFYVMMSVDEQLRTPLTSECLLS